MYAKLYCSVLNSSLWAEDAHVCKLFITMLVMADREGFIYGSKVGLARQACMDQPETDTALERLLAPDPNSTDLLRNPENDGRRVEVTQNGWRIYNYPYYRDLRDADERREQVRGAVKRHRAKKRNQVKSDVITVIPGNQSKPSESESAQSQMQSHLIESAPRRQRFSPPTPADVDAFVARKYPEYVGIIRGSKFCSSYDAKGWMIGKTKMRDWKAAVHTWVETEVDRL